jgi:hypothetical protein
LTIGNTRNYRRQNFSLFPLYFCQQMIRIDR